MSNRKKFIRGVLVHLDDLVEAHLVRLPHLLTAWNDLGIDSTLL